MAVGTVSIIVVLRGFLRLPHFPHLRGALAAEATVCGTLPLGTSSWRALCARALAFAMPTRKLLYRLNLLRLCTHSTVLMLTRYGTLGQNKIRDVATICAYKNKRTSPEHFSLRNKAHRALLRNEKFLKKSFVFEAAQIAATSPYLSPPYKVLVSLPVTQYRHYMVKPY